DWNEVLKPMNRWYDRLVEILRKPDYLERSAAIRQLDLDLKALVEKRRGAMALLALLGGPKAITQMTSDVLISLLLPEVNVFLATEGRAIQKMHSLEIAFALAAWRSEHDSYPDSL